MSRFANVEKDKTTMSEDNRGDGSTEKTQRTAPGTQGWRRRNTHFRWGLSLEPGQRFLAPAWFPQGKKVRFILTE